jgi:predicted DNA-binding protein
MSVLSERLEVRLPPETARLLRKVAERCGVSVARLVREAINLLLQEDRQARLRAAEALDPGDAGPLG